MKSTQTFGVHFILRKENTVGALIYARIVVDKTRCELSTKQRIRKIDWDKVRGLAKTRSSTLDHKNLNSNLEQVRGQIAQHYHQLKLEQKQLNAEMVKNAYLGIEKKPFCLIDLVNYHNDKFKGVLAHGTLKNYYTTLKYIKLFLKKQYNLSDMSIHDLKYPFIVEFELFLRKSNPLDHNQPLSNNGVMKHLERLRKMAKLAAKMQWLGKDPFEYFPLKFQKVERGFLNEEELEAIEKKEINLSRLVWVRDLFVFSCYTGLSYIDVMQLRSQNLIAGIDGKKWIKTFRQKSNIPVSVPILPKAQLIIDIYKTDPRAIQNGTLFPVITNQKMNSYLKEIAKICEIDKDLTYHLARHTFATTVTLSNGVPIETVSKMLGHTKITTTQIYAKVIERKVSEDMDILLAKLNQNEIKRINMSKVKSS